MMSWENKTKEQKYRNKNKKEEKWKEKILRENQSEFETFVL